MIYLNGVFIQIMIVVLTKSIRRLLIAVSLFTLFTSLFACSGSGNGSSQGGVSENGGNITVNLSKPADLISPLIVNLQADISLNGDTPENLFVDDIDNTVSGLVADVSAGNHEVLIRYFVIIDGIEMTLASISKLVTVVAGETLDLKVSDSDLVFNYDDDGDGITNLAEMKLGSNPDNSAEIPVFALPFSPGVASYVTATTASGFDVLSGVGGSIAGKTESVNYQLETGFIAQ